MLNKLSFPVLVIFIIYIIFTIVTSIKLIKKFTQNESKIGLLVGVWGHCCVVVILISTYIIYYP